MKNLLMAGVLCSAFTLTGCFGGLRNIKVVDYTDQRVTDLSLTRKVTGRREFIFFSTVKMGVFLEGCIQGIITDYQGNPIEGVTVRVAPAAGKDKGLGIDDVGIIEENASASVNLSFSPGISDTLGLYKIRFSLPVTDDEVDMTGKIVFNPGWDQQKINLGKAYEPQMKENPFRLYYSLKTGFLAFAEGVRKAIVQPVGEGTGRLQVLPGSKAPPQTPAGAAAGKAKTEQEAAQGSAGSAGSAGSEEDLFKGFDFGN